MKFLNKKSKVVDFVSFELMMWGIRNELDVDIRVLSECKSVSVSRVKFDEISTYHNIKNGKFYCNDELVFFIESIRDFSDEPPRVRKVFFDENLVNEERIERLLSEMKNFSDKDERKISENGLNIWKAESCELALAG